ncbi:MAG: hypothetical protein CME06_00915 [Gemmatimonadetes bacterium]|nr:hypothetical protein [Gemmatimonadota bacterium]
MHIIPERLAAACRLTHEHRIWLERLPCAINALQAKWSLSPGAPFDGCGGSCAWVAPAVRDDGTRAILKLGMPHSSKLSDPPEADQDVVIAGLPRRLCRRPSRSHSFRPLSEMTAYWARETIAASS